MSSKSLPERTMILYGITFQLPYHLFAFKQTYVDRLLSRLINAYHNGCRLDNRISLFSDSELKLFNSVH